MVTDHRKLPRRRGEALNAAILQATLEELTEVGYGKLTMERVAERARTGKASVYRRWPSRMELVMDAVHQALPTPRLRRTWAIRPARPSYAGTPRAPVGRRCSRSPAAPSRLGASKWGRRLCASTFCSTAPPIPDDVIVEIVDEVIVPLFSTSRGASRPVWQPAT